MTPSYSPPVPLSRCLYQGPRNRRGNVGRCRSKIPTAGVIRQAIHFGRNDMFGWKPFVGDLGDVLTKFHQTILYTSSYMYSRFCKISWYFCSFEGTPHDSVWDAVRQKRPDLFWLQPQATFRHHCLVRTAYLHVLLCMACDKSYLSMTWTLNLFKVAERTAIGAISYYHYVVQFALFLFYN